MESFDFVLFDAFLSLIFFVSTAFRPEEEREEAEEYSHDSSYFIAQIVTICTHETVEISAEITDVLIFSHILYSNSSVLLNAIKDRWQISFFRYSFTTYQYETSSMQRIKNEKRYDLISSTDDKVMDIEEWNLGFKQIIQKKCLNMLLKWTQNYWLDDFVQNEQMMSTLSNFIADVKQTRNENLKNDKIYAAFLQSFLLKMDALMATTKSWFAPIVNEIKSKKLRQQKQTHRRTHSVTNTVSTFSDKLFDELKTDYFDDYEWNNNNTKPNDICSHLSFVTIKNQQNAKEYAKQLTLLDFGCFVGINSRMCLFKILHKTQTDKWIKIKDFIDRFHQIHQYVIVQIAAAPSLKTRIEMIEFFIFCSEHCLKLNNLYSFMAIISALDNVQIKKMNVAWNGINKSAKRKFESFLAPLCSANNNYKALRVYSKKMSGPAIPFLGILLRDLTFLNDANKDQVEKIINFEKYVLFYRVLWENIERFQLGTYSKRMWGVRGHSLMHGLAENDDDGQSKELVLSIVPDLALQKKIAKDLSSYILLKKDLIRHMIADANRIDALEGKTK